jgi:mannan polymerase II complex MNN10 subunit
VAYSPSTAEAATFHRRRTDSRGLHAAPEGLNNSHLSSLGTTSFIAEDGKSPARPKHMSLDRSPSPQQGGGWSSPGLNTPYEEGTARSRGSSPTKKSYGELNGGHVTWASAKASSARVKGQASYQSQNQGFFSRHMRRISERLPYFAHGGQEDRYREKEKLGRGRGSLWIHQIDWRELPKRIAFVISRRRKHVAMLISLILLIVLWFNPSRNCP